MEENEIIKLAAAENPISKVKKPIAEKVSLWIAIISSIVTICLTIWNGYTKTLIDQREENLKTLELTLKERSTGVEESKERVDRYKWVFSLFPNLNKNDDKEKNFTINLIRLALTNDEAHQLFTGLQASSDSTLQSLGQNGINTIENEPISNLVSQMNASTAELRKHSVAALVKDYKSSSQAITLTLRMYDHDKINNLSASAVINGLIFLSLTDSDSWNKEQILDGKNIVKRIRDSKPGQQTQTALNSFEALLKKLE